MQTGQIIHHTSDLCAIPARPLSARNRKYCIWSYGVIISGVVCSDMKTVSVYPSALPKSRLLFGLV